MGEYPTRDNTYWQTASQWWVSILTKFTQRQPRSKGGYPSGDYTYWQTVSQWWVSIPLGITLTDRQPHSDGWVSQPSLLIDSLRVRVAIPVGITLTDRQPHSDGWVSHWGLHLLTDSLTVMGEYPTGDYTYWQTASQWGVSIPVGITLTDRELHSEGWVSHQGLHLLTDRQPHSDGWVPYQGWHLLTDSLTVMVSIPPGITLTDRQPHSDGWVP